jgi:hypothetical protein
MAQTVGTPVATATTPGTLSVTLPSFSAGDSMFVLAGTKQMSTETFGAHTDWTTLLSVRTSTIVAIAVFHRIMQGGDPTTFTLNTIGSNDVNMAIAWVDTDLDETDAIDVIGADGNSATGAGAMTVPGITAGTAKRVYGAWVGFDNDATSGTTTGAAAFDVSATSIGGGAMTELFDAVTDTGADLSLGVAYKDAVTGATGDQAVTGTPASLTNYRCLGFLFSVNPAAGGAALEHDIDDAIAGTDATAGASVFARSVGDTGTLTDNVNAGGSTGHTKNLDDSIQGTDAAARAAGFARTAAADGIQGTDSVSKRPGPGIADAISVTDTGFEMDTAYVLADTGTVTDNVNTGASSSHTKNLDDAIQGTDATAREADYVRALADTGVWTDLANTGGSSAHTKSLSDSLTVADMPSPTWGAARTVTDTGTVTDSSTRISGAALLIQDAIQGTDSSALVYGATRTIGDGMAVSEDVEGIGDPVVVYIGRVEVGAVPGGRVEH